MTNAPRLASDIWLVLACRLAWQVIEQDVEA